MKKILHVSYSMDTGGGPLTIKRIVEDFREYEYFVSGNPGVYMEHFKKILPASHILGLKGPNLFFNLWLLITFCRRNSIDILHVHGRGAASFARFVKIFRPKTKVVYTPNGFFPKSLPFLIRQLYVLGERVLFLLTDLVFFVSRSEQATFARSLWLKNQNKKFIYIQNYINEDLLKEKPMLPFEHMTDRSPKFLFIGRLSMQKGVDILIESLKIFDDAFHLTVIGYGEMEDYLRGEIKNDFAHSIDFKGKVNEAFRYMPNFDALLLPSRFEGLPFTVLEAMLYRLPLIVTPCNGTIDLMGEGNGYVSESIDAVSFAKAVSNFCRDFKHDKNRIQEMISRNFQIVRTEYSMNAVKEKINYLYSLDH